MTLLNRKEQIEIIKPPTKRDLIVFSAIGESRSLVIACADRSLAIKLNETYGSCELRDWVHNDMYEMRVSDLYDFGEVVQYIKARYE